MVLPRAEFWDQTHWFALHTRARHEKRIDTELRKRGIETFLPVRKVTHRWSDRLKKIEEPIFPGYLFVHIPLKDRFQVLRAEGAVRLVGFDSYPMPVPEKELQQIRRFVEVEIALDPYPYLSVGNRVYVRSGPLKGVEGFIIRKDRHTRLVISLDLLMQSISVQVDEGVVEKI